MQKFGSGERDVIKWRDVYWEGWWYCYCVDTGYFKSVLFIRECNLCRCHLKPTNTNTCLPFISSVYPTTQCVSTAESRALTQHTMCTLNELLLLILTWSLLLLLSFPTAPCLAHAVYSQSSTGDDPPPPTDEASMRGSGQNRSRPDSKISPSRDHSQRRQRTHHTTATSARNYVATTTTTTTNTTTTPAIAANTTYRRQLRSSSQHSTQSSTSSGPAPSIRLTALNPSQSTGSYVSSVSSSQSSYNVAYRQQRHQQSQQLHLGEEDGNSDSDEDTDSLVPINLNPTGGPSNPRICICDNFKYPKDCKTQECRPVYGQACTAHKDIQCQSLSCDKSFHVDCIASLQRTTIEDIVADGYTCMECEADTPIEPIDAEDQVGVLRRDLMHLGIDLPDPATQTQIAKAKRDQTKLLNMLNSEECEIPQNDINAILNNYPRSYPCPVNMDSTAAKDHVVHGRRHEVSMFLYVVDQCECCGKVQPGHVDPIFPDHPTFERQHLVNKYHRVWRCTCDGFCKGSQFYPSQKPTVINKYKLHHGNRAPWDYMSVEKEDPNAIICHKCYDEIGSSGGPTSGKSFSSTYVVL